MRASCCKFSSAKLHNIDAWAVAVTSAPRPHPTLERCLDSLANAGWNQPHLFAEPSTEIPHRYRELRITQRDAPIGPWPNWYLALLELVLIDPHVEAYFLVQDDVVFAKNIRHYLAGVLWPSDDTGAVSIYCPRTYAIGKAVGLHEENRGWRNWTAQALVFPKVAAREILTCPNIIGYRHHGRSNGIKHIDGVIGEWCRVNRRRFYVHQPSLAQHIGSTSTIYPERKLVGHRSASTFVGEDFETTELNLNLKSPP